MSKKLYEWLLEELPDDYRKDQYDKTNLEYFKSIQRLIRDGINVVPFAGAGVSAPFNIKQWLPFLEYAIEELDLSDNKEVNDLLKNGHLDEVARFLDLNHEISFENLIREEYGKELNKNLLSKSIIYEITRISNGLVFTTNFDDMLRQGLKLYSKLKYETVRPEEDLLELVLRRIKNRENVLVQLHGTYSNKQSRVLTSQQYNEKYLLNEKHNSIDFNKSLPLLIQQIASSRLFLFLGCSLESDKTLFTLKDVFEKNKLHDHYAFMEAIEKDPENDEDGLTNFEYKKQTEDRLNKAGIKVIWFPNKQGNFKCLKQLMGVLARSKVDLHLTHNGKPLKNPSAHHSTFIYKQLQKSQITIRHALPPETYRKFATRLPKDWSYDNRLLWTMNGSPLDVHSSILGTKDKLSPQDRLFSDYDIMEKFRIIIFDGKDDLNKYISPPDDLIERKDSFVNSIEEGGAKLFFATKKSLKKIGIEVYLDIGFLSPIDDRSGVFFCSEINSSDIHKDVYHAFHDVCVFSENGYPQFPESWHLSSESKSDKSITDIRQVMYNIHRRIPTLIDDLHEEEAGGFYSRPKDLLTWEKSN